MDERKDYQDDSSKEQDKLPHLTEALNRKNLMEIGRKGITPFAHILYRYRDEVTPFIEAMEKGCDAAVRELSALDKEQSPAVKNVAQWFNQGAQLLKESQSKINQNDANVFLDFIKDESMRRPVMMFSTSYLLGVFAGRLGKKQYSTNKVNSLH